MKLIIEIKLVQAMIPKDYRPILLSLFKNCLESTHKDYYEKIYVNNTLSKEMTFCVRLPSPQFEKDFIQLKGETVCLVVSTSDYELLIEFYNALHLNRGKPFPIAISNQMTIERVKIDVSEQRIESYNIIIRLLSPLIIRQHNKESNVDQFCHSGQDGFKLHFKRVVDEQLSRAGYVGKSVEIECIEPKKTVVSLFGLKVNASLGTYKLIGEPNVLNYLLHNGLGSKRNQGFGMFEVMD